MAVSWSGYVSLPPPSSLSLLHHLEEHPCFSLFLSFSSSLSGTPCFSPLPFPFLHHLKEHLCFHLVSFSLIILKIAWNRIKLLEIRSDGLFWWHWFFTQLSKTAGMGLSSASCSQAWMTEAQSDLF